MVMNQLSAFFYKRRFETLSIYLNLLFFPQTSTIIWMAFLARLSVPTTTMTSTLTRATGTMTNMDTTIMTTTTTRNGQSRLRARKKELRFEFEDYTCFNNDQFSRMFATVQSTIYWVSTVILAIFLQII